MRSSTPFVGKVDSEHNGLRSTNPIRNLAPSPLTLLVHGQQSRLFSVKKGVFDIVHAHY